MTYKSKVVLQTPLKVEGLLEQFVENCLRDHVELIAVVGDGCEAVHDLIDEIVVDDGSDESRFIMTTWHDDESLEETLEFAAYFGGIGPYGLDEVQLVEI